MATQTIPLPGSEDVDIHWVKPIIDHELYQNLNSRKQLGTGYLTFPTAQHTRFEHGLGTFSLTQRRVARWIKNGSITAEDGLHLSLFGLLHDVGHGPYSHATEALCAINHKENGIRVLQILREQIEQCGGNFERILRLLKGEDSLAVGVTQHPLGADKLDYLVRDAAHTNEAISLTMGALLNYVYFIDGQLVIDCRIISEVVMAQMAYVYMFDRVYFRKSCAITQRFLQKIVALLMADTNPPEVRLTEDRLWRLVDDELNTILRSSPNTQVNTLFQRLRIRQYPKTALAICAEGLESREPISGKKVIVRSLPLEKLSRLEYLHCPHAGSRLEKEIADLTGVPSEALLITPMIPITRFLPQDVPVYDRAQRLGMLSDLRPAHYASLREMAASCTTVRVCVFDEYRDQIATPRVAQQIMDYLKQTVCA